MSPRVPFLLSFLVVISIQVAKAQMNTNDLLEGFAIKCGINDTREGKGIWYRARQGQSAWERVSMAEALGSKGYELAEVWSKDQHRVLVLFESSEKNPGRIFTCYGVDGYATTAIEAVKTHNCEHSRVVELTFENGKQVYRKARFYKESDSAPLVEVAHSNCAEKLPERSVISKVSDLPFDRPTGN